MSAARPSPSSPVATAAAPSSASPSPPASASAAAAPAAAAVQRSSSRTRVNSMQHTHANQEEEMGSQMYFVAPPGESIVGNKPFALELRLLMVPSQPPTREGGGSGGGAGGSPAAPQLFTPSHSSAPITSAAVSGAGSAAASAASAPSTATDTDAAGSGQIVLFTLAVKVSAKHVEKKSNEYTRAECAWMTTAGFDEAQAHSISGPSSTSAAGAGAVSSSSSSDDEDEDDRSSCRSFLSPEKICSAAAAASASPPTLAAAAAACSTRRSPAPASRMLSPIKQERGAAATAAVPRSPSAASSKAVAKKAKPLFSPLYKNKKGAASSSTSSPARSAVVAEEQKDRSIGTAVILLQRPPTALPQATSSRARRKPMVAPEEMVKHMLVKLEPLEREGQRGLLVHVLTKGGSSAKRPRQKYMLLQSGYAYALTLPVLSASCNFSLRLHSLRLRTWEQQTATLDVLPSIDDLPAFLGSPAAPRSHKSAKSRRVDNAAAATAARLPRKRRAAACSPSPAEAQALPRSARRSLSTQRDARMLLGAAAEDGSAADDEEDDEEEEEEGGEEDDDEYVDCGTRSGAQMRKKPSPKKHDTRASFNAKRQRLALGTSATEPSGSISSLPTPFPLMPPSRSAAAAATALPAAPLLSLHAPPAVDGELEAALRGAAAHAASASTARVDAEHMQSEPPRRLEHHLSRRERNEKKKANKQRWALPPLQPLPSARPTRSMSALLQVAAAAQRQPVPDSTDAPQPSPVQHLSSAAQPTTEPATPTRHQVASSLAPSAKKTPQRALFTPPGNGVAARPALAARSSAIFRPPPSVHMQDSDDREDDATGSCASEESNHGATEYKLETMATTIPPMLPPTMMSTPMAALPYPMQQAPQQGAPFSYNHAFPPPPLGLSSSPGASGGSASAMAFSQMHAQPATAWHSTPISHQHATYGSGGLAVPFTSSGLRSGSNGGGGGAGNGNNLSSLMLLNSPGPSGSGPGWSPYVRGAMPLSPVPRSAPLLPPMSPLQVPLSPSSHASASSSRTGHQALASSGSAVGGTGGASPLLGSFGGAPSSPAPQATSFGLAPYLGSGSSLVSNGNGGGGGGGFMHSSAAAVASNGGSGHSYSPPQGRPRLPPLAPRSAGSNGSASSPGSGNALRRASASSPAFAPVAASSSTRASNGAGSASFSLHSSSGGGGAASSMHETGASMSLSMRMNSPVVAALPATNPHEMDLELGQPLQRYSAADMFTLRRS